MRKVVALRYLALLPMLEVLSLNYAYFIGLPAYDYWAFVIAYYDFRLLDWKTRLWLYWQPFGDHMHLFPKLMIDLFIWLTNNQHYGLEIAFGFGTRLLMVYLLWLLLRRTELSEPNKTLAFLVGAFLIFWPIQQLTFQVQIYSTVFGWCLPMALLSLYFLQKFWGRWSGIALGALAYMVSAYSQGSGMSLGLAIGLVLLPQKEWSGKQKAVWWLITLVVIGLYQISMPPRVEAGLLPVTDSLRAPWQCASFFLKSFVPPFAELPGYLWLYTAVGVSILIFSLLPVLLLFKKNRLLNPMAFPWATLVLWCVVMAAMGALARSAGEPIPRPTYYTSSALAVVGAVPLWLFLYPNIWPPQRADWMSLSGLARVVVFGSLGGIYLLGCWEGVGTARYVHKAANVYQSCLHYYPAADLTDYSAHIIGTYSVFLEKLTEAFPNDIDPTPFTILVPTTFEIGDLNEMYLTEDLITPGVFPLVTGGQDSYIVLTPTPAIHKRHVVFFTIETSAPADVEFYWNDGTGWSAEKKSIQIDRKGELVTTSCGYFPESSSVDRYRPVEKIGLRFIKQENPSTQVTIRDLQVFTR